MISLKQRSKIAGGVHSQRHEFMIGGRRRSYLQLNPTTPAKPELPIVLMLHGSSQNGASIRSFSGGAFDKLASHGLATVAYPDGLKKLWNHASNSSGEVNDVAFISALIDHLRSDCGPVPVIIAGYSNGGQLLIRLIHEIPQKFNGATIISATLPRPGGLAFRDQHVAMPVLMLHGTGDPIVRYDGEGSFWGRFARNVGPSAPETAEYFARRNGIEGPPVLRQLPHRPESGRTRVIAADYVQDDALPVTFYTIEGGGHVVPNRQKRAIFVLGRTTQDVSTVESMTQFFPALRPPTDS